MDVRLEAPVRGDPEGGDIDIIIIKVVMPEEPVVEELFFRYSMSFLDRDLNRYELSLLVHIIKTQKDGINRGDVVGPGHI